MIFGHGPWYTEWHHIAEFVLAVPAVGVVVLWVRENIRKK